MSFNLTRRRFGLLGLSAALLTLPKTGAIAAMGYMFPQLLAESADLVEVPDLTDELVIIDVRSREEYNAGHVPGAHHLDPNAVAAPHGPVAGALRPIAEIEQLLGALGVAATKRIVFYDDRGGFHAARMLWLMEYLGHRDVAILNGGLSAWLEAMGTLSQEAPIVAPAIFQAAVSPRRHATADDVLAHRDRPAAVLIDVRPPKLYNEGHIPWAVNIPWAQNLDESGRFRSAGDLAVHFANHGVTPDQAVIIHCQAGLASSHSYVALRLLGFQQVRVYHRSWAEWGADPSLPKKLG